MYLSPASKPRRDSLTSKMLYRQQQEVANFAYKCHAVQEVDISIVGWLSSLAFYLTIHGLMSYLCCVKTVIALCLLCFIFHRSHTFSLYLYFLSCLNSTGSFLSSIYSKHINTKELINSDFCPVLLPCPFTKMARAHHL